MLTEGMAGKEDMGILFCRRCGASGREAEQKEPTYLCCCVWQEHGMQLRQEGGRYLSAQIQAGKEQALRRVSVIESGILAK